MNLSLRRLPLAVVCALAAAPALASDPTAPPAPATTFTWVETDAVAPEADPAADPAELAAARAELDAAREELRAVTRRIAELSSRIGGSEARRALAFRYLNNPERAMIGVVFGRGEGTTLELAAVTPGGPAEKAGLRAGDRVIAINGKPVASGEAALASAQALVGSPKAGDRVALTIERDGKRQELEATAERRTSWEWPVIAQRLAPLVDSNVEVIIDGATIGREVAEGLERMDAGRLRVLERLHEDLDVEAGLARSKALGELRRIVVGRGGSFFDLRLAELNPDLGRYFGSEDGVLVLSHSGDSLPGVKSGDVIVSIGGERTDTPGDVMRALAERADQRGVNVEVLRDRKREVLVVDVPSGSNFEVLFPAPPAPPAAPRAPVPPKAARPPAPGAAAPAPPRPPVPPVPPAPRLEI